MWKPFRNATLARAPKAAILFDKFHIMRHLGEALDKVRKREYARLIRKDRRYIKCQKYTLLSRRENITLEGRRSKPLNELLQQKIEMFMGDQRKRSKFAIQTINGDSGHGI